MEKRQREHAHSKSTPEWGLEGWISIHAETNDGWRKVVSISNRTHTLLPKQTWESPWRRVNSSSLCPYARFFLRPPSTELATRSSLSLCVQWRYEASSLDDFSGLPGGVSRKMSHIWTEIFSWWNVQKLPSIHRRVARVSFTFFRLYIFFNCRLFFMVLFFPSSSPFSGNTFFFSWHFQRFI